MAVINTLVIRWAGLKKINKKNHLMSQLARQHNAWQSRPEQMDQIKGTKCLYARKEGQTNTKKRINSRISSNKQPKGKRKLFTTDWFCLSATSTVSKLALASPPWLVLRLFSSLEDIVNIWNNSHDLLYYTDHRTTR